MKKFLVLLCFLLGCVQPAAHPSIPAMESRTVVLVEFDDDHNEHVFCTGTWVSDDQILTAAHCVRDTMLMVLGGEDQHVDSVQYRMKADKGVRVGDVQKYDPAHDLALVQAREKSGHAIAHLGGAPNVGDDVFSVGAPLGMDYSYIPGVVSSMDRQDSDGLKMIQVSMALAPGDSGAAIFNSNGELVGVVSKGSRRFPIHFCIHRDHVVDLLKGP